MSLITIDFSNTGIIFATDDVHYDAVNKPEPAGDIKDVCGNFLIGCTYKHICPYLAGRAEEICREKDVRNACNLIKILAGENIREPYFVADSTGEEVWVSDNAGISVYDSELSAGRLVFLHDNPDVRHILKTVCPGSFSSSEDARQKTEAVYDGIRKATEAIDKHALIGYLAKMYIISDGKIEKA